MEAYWAAVLIALVVGVAACRAARQGPPWVAAAIGRSIALVLAAVAVVFVVRPVFEGGWSVRTSLPLNLCDIALILAAITCWWPGWALGVELTWYWGMAGTTQAIATPDLGARFPSLTFLQFVVGHVGIVLAAVYLVVGLRRRPRPGSAVRCYLITVLYTGAVALVDVLTGSNYMYLARTPGHRSLLSVLGPWPWYILSAAAVAAVLFAVLGTAARIPDRSATMVRCGDRRGRALPRVRHAR